MATLRATRRSKRLANWHCNLSKKPPSQKELNAAQEYAVSRRYLPLSPKMGRVSAFQELHRELIKSSALYESKDLQNKRDAVALAILAVERYINQRGLAPITSRPLMRVLSALTERENNTLDPLFSERPRASRPKSTLADHQRAGAIAAMANHWLAHNRDKTRPQREQLSEIARKLRSGGLEGVTAARIKQARELVSAETKEHPACSFYTMIEGWLRDTSANFGEENAFSIVLPILAENIDILKN
jgi:hypothetical protein